MNSKKEAIMKLGDTDIRIFDKNKEYGLIAPLKSSTGSVWLNIYVDDIETFFNNAVKHNVNVISPINEFKDIPAKKLCFLISIIIYG